MKNIGVGFVGAGSNTKLRHLPGFLAQEEVSLVSVANRTKKSSESVANEFGIARTCSDWIEVIEDPEVDAVCIGTWPNLHCEITCEALFAGKHVLCEARMARNLVEAKQMYEASRKRPDLVAQLVPSPFTLGVDGLVAQKVASGLLGNIHEVRVRFLNGTLIDPQTPFNWRMDEELSGQNTMVLGILHEAILRWIELPGLVIQAGSAGWGAAMRPHLEGDGSSRKYIIPESLQIAAKASNGIRLLYDLSQLYGGEEEHSILISGSAGTVYIDLVKRFLKWESCGESGEKQLEDGWDVEGQFIRSIRSNEPVLRTSFSDGLKYMKFTSDVWDSWSDSDSR